jgi:hypothetical protein
MRPEFQRDLWSLAIGTAALAAVMLSAALHRAGVPGRAIIGVAVSVAVATGLTLGISELIDRLGRQKTRRKAAKALHSPRVTRKEAQQPVPPQREQQGHANDQNGAAERYHDE